jgi:uncharacterized protein YpmS
MYLYNSKIKIKVCVSFTGFINITNGHGNVQLDVMPVTSGHVPLPTVTLFQCVESNGMLIVYYTMKREHSFNLESSSLNQMCQMRPHLVNKFGDIHLPVCVFDADFQFKMAPCINGIMIS